MAVMRDTSWIKRSHPDPAYVPLSPAPEADIRFRVFQDPCLP